MNTLTPEFLSALGIADEPAAQILAACAADVSALTAERDDLAARNATLVDDRTAAEESAARAVSELEQYRAEQAAAEEEATIRRAVRAALLKEGANPQIVPLLEKEIPSASVIIGMEGELVNADDLIQPLKARYPGLFAKTACVPAPSADLPVSPEAISRADLNSMSTEEINRNWSQVRAALSMN